MRSSTSFLFRYVRQHHVAIFAIFLALSSTAYAASLSRNSVKSRHIKNGEVKAADIAANAVGSARIPNGSLLGVDVKDGTLATEDLKDGTVATADLKDGTVATADLADGAITPTKQGVVPSVRVFKGTPTSIPESSLTTISFADESFDTANMHSPATNPSRLTAPIAGIYLLTATATWSNHQNGYRQIQVYKNGGGDRQATILDSANANDVGSAYLYQNLATPLALEAGDYVEIMLYQNSGGALNHFADQTDDTNASLTWIGPKQ